VKEPEGECFPVWSVLATGGVQAGLYTIELASFDEGKTTDWVCWKWNPETRSMAMIERFADTLWECMEAAYIDSGLRPKRESKIPPHVPEEKFLAQFALKRMAA